MHIDWQTQGGESVARLQSMLRFDTTNPPGNERALVEHLAAELASEGLQAQILESAPQRANLVVRLEGDGSERPLLLLSHLDVVPAEPAQWSHPPFAGEVADGLVWGRGAVDSKLTTTVGIQVLLLCKRLGLPLKRDLVLVAAADEELGGVHGVQWLAENHPDVFDAEYGINEAGGFALLVDGRPVYTCQVGEKGGAELDIITHGQPGHSSVPHDDNAVFHLAQALARMAGQKMPHRLTPSVRAFFEETARVQQREQVAQDLLALLDPERQVEALARLPLGQPTRLMFDAMLRSTCAPTVLQAGIKRNVIPSAATAQLSGRPLPGVDAETFVEEVRSLVGDEVELNLGTFRPGVEFKHQTPLFDAIAASMGQWDPQGAVVPYMVTGGTDARFLRDRDIQIYGFIPMRYEEGMDFFDLCHGHDERVSVANVHFAVQVLHDVVCRLNGLV
ncbi:MAG: M20/M25/M40 family metallo-hydrolase [Candidatus Latescibacteria bacterium]|nr:M20/M25/M40 family metallo-hydrolase [Candidatus Latescibacterota bacterium]